MDTNNENNDQNIVSVTVRMDATLHRAVKRVADVEDRSLTKQIERLLKNSPEIAEQLEAETAAA
jgi:hypothetical protein